ncbi:MAG: hypothetical protein U1C47_04010 [Hydrogenophaga sp.]|nr:hypothetical protein [Hydrogenophaga sp.]
MGDRHKMHHFARVDANGRPDRSVLEDPATVQRAQDRRDVQGMRGVITAVGRGPVGNALDAVDVLRGPLPPGEPARREREADAPSVQSPASRPKATGPALSRTSQALLNDSQREVRQLAATHHLPWDRGLDNTVCSLACCARENGLSCINLLRVNNGQIRFGQHEHGVLKDGVHDARQASLEPRNGTQPGWMQPSVHEPQLRAM